MFNDRIAHVVFGAGAVGCLHRLVLDRILELVVREIGRDHFQSHQPDHAEGRNEQDQLQSRHKQQSPVRWLRIPAIEFSWDAPRAVFPSYEAVGRNPRKYSVMAEILTSEDWRVER